MLTDLHGIELRSVLAAIAAMSLGGCMAGQSTRTPAGPLSVDERREVIERQAREQVPARTPTKQASGDSGEVPAAIENLFVDDLMLRALVRREAITILEASQQEWPDGALGCAAPGMNYMQMLTPGYRVKLQANGQTYSYHSDLKGRFVLCDGGVPAPPAKRASTDKPSQ
ncbi:MAG: hypothetical protein ABW106_03505 [Steroidobacteraceae bacterium]